MSLIFILITLAVSVYAFSNYEVIQKLSLKPVLVLQQKQWYRVFSHALVHADYVHLLVNMYVLWSFGRVCEVYFEFYFGTMARFHFIALYLLSLVFSSAYSLYKHKGNHYYSAIGASGAVMAVVFTSIFFNPWNMLYFFGIIPIPGILFGILFLGYSVYMGKNGKDNIGHDAHFTGAIFGFLYPVLIRPSLFGEFLEKLIAR